MLGDAEITPTLAVKDLDAAKKFYGEVLGLEQINEGPAGVTYKSGSGRILVYPSEYAGTNQATYAGWTVSDIEAVVDELKGKGVEFEHYDNLGGPMELQGDLHVAGEFKSAWFKDPSGNILAIDNGGM